MTFSQQKGQKKKPKNPFMPQVVPKVNKYFSFLRFYMLTVVIQWNHVLLLQNKTTQKKSGNQNGGGGGGSGSGSDLAEVLKCPGSSFNQNKTCDTENKTQPGKEWELRLLWYPKYKKPTFINCFMLQEVRWQ